MNYPVGTGLTLEQIAAEIKAKSGRDVPRESLLKFVAAGLLIEKDGLYYRSAVGIELARETLPLRRVLDAMPLDVYTLSDGRHVEGQALSFVVQHLRGEGISLPSAYHDQADVLRVCGRAVDPGRNVRNQKCQVVYRPSQVITKVN